MPALVDGSPRPGPGDWLAVGWLGPASAFPTGPVGEPYRHRLFCERLFEACRSWVVDGAPGHHVCPFCPLPDDGRMPPAERSGRRARLGSGEIHAVDRSGGRWAAPTLVYHYVAEHGYRPPDGFVDAVVAGKVHAPDALPLGALRLGDPVGALTDLDPELDAEVRAELAAAGLDGAVVAGIGIRVSEAERVEPPGVRRPVLTLEIGPVGGNGGHLVAFDGGDSWRAGVRAVRGLDG
jgi:hypothetical protein